MFDSLQYYITEYLVKTGLLKYAYFILVVFALYWIFRVIVYLCIKKCKKYAEKTETDIDDFLVEVLGTLRWPLFFIGVLIAVYNFFDIHWLQFGVRVTLVIFIVYQVISILMRFIDFGTDKFIVKKFKEKEIPYLDFFKLLIKIAVWGIGIILILANLGYNVSSLLAGLGIGGIAVALAIQNILGDIFSSISIFLDKPFKKGDFVMMGTEGGTVEKIGIKTTRLTTLNGDELVVPNQKLVSGDIRNYGKMRRRRVTFSFGVLYETPHKKMKQIPDLVEKVFERIDQLTLDRINFATYGDFSLNFEVVYYVETNDYAEYAALREQMNLGIMEIFEKEKIEMAYPTQTLYVKK